jgi:acylphosphatase
MTVSTPSVRYRVTVSGRVQGVFYRQSCQRHAVAAGVAGWIRNTPDGRVEAVLEGDEPDVLRVLEWMHIGPPRATVTRLDAHPELPRSEQGFTIID